MTGPGAQGEFKMLSGNVVRCIDLWDSVPGQDPVEMAHAGEQLPASGYYIGAGIAPGWCGEVEVCAFKEGELMISPDYRFRPNEVPAAHWRLDFGASHVSAYETNHFATVYGDGLGQRNTPSRAIGFARTGLARAECSDLSIVTYQTAAPTDSFGNKVGWLYAGAEKPNETDDDWQDILEGRVDLECNRVVGTLSELHAVIAAMSRIMGMNDLDSIGHADMVCRAFAA